MKTASVSDLKANLSRYLRMVRRGSELQILDRGVPVARLVGPVGASGPFDPGDKERLDRLTKAGVLRRGSGDARWLLSEPAIVVPGADLRGALADDRQDRL
ncbi:MAG TPA: type II toxin-antitoxin system prevent-host-death family antitoxin [Polyangia bacterium]|nr:type II toxin-antitoxin system prevent-host-death family antitoxin [Polyangia bacterium]